MNFDGTRLPGAMCLAAVAMISLLAANGTRVSAQAAAQPAGAGFANGVTIQFAGGAATLDAGFGDGSCRHLAGDVATAAAEGYKACRQDHESG